MLWLNIIQKETRMKNTPTTAFNARSGNRKTGIGDALAEMVWEIKAQEKSAGATSSQSPAHTPASSPAA